MNKICKKCNREFPLNDTYFYKNKQLKDGFENQCKECRGVSFGKRKVRPIVEEGMKFCSVCENVYPNTLDFFSSDSQRKDGLSYYCKNCINKTNRKNYNPKKKREYYDKNIEHIRDKNKRYYILNRDKILNRDRIYKQSDRGKAMMKASRQKRRALSKKLLTYLTTEQWMEKLRNFNYKCAYCGCEHDNLTIDHFVPVSKGGELSISNVVPCCPNCNSSKNKYNFFEWYPRQSFYSKERENFILKHLKYKNGVQQISIL